MPKYKYRAIKDDGSRVSGEIKATDLNDVRKFLRSRGIKPIKIEAPSILELDINEYLVRTIPNKKLLLFCKNFATMIGAGIPLIESLEILYEQEDQHVLKNSLRNILINVEEGKTLHEAMRIENKFGKLFINLIKAGEREGKLDAMLERVNSYLERSIEIKKKVKKAMTYPAIVSGVGMVVVVGMLVFVVPKMAEMIQSNGGELPVMTRLVMGASEFLQKNILFFLGGLGLVFGAFKYFVDNNAEFRLQFHTFLTKAPVIKNVVVKSNLSNFCRTLSTLLNSGTSIIDALELSIDPLENDKIAKDLQKVKTSVQQGRPLYDSLKKIDYFPLIISQMIRVGEQTGKLDEMLGKVSDVYEEELRDTIDSATSMLEPGIMVILGIIIAIILVAMYQPIFESAGQMT